MTETLSVPDFDVYPVRQALSGARIVEGDVEVRWRDGSASVLPSLWLREFSPDLGTIHPVTREQVVMLADLPDDLRAAAVDVLPDGRLEVTWHPEGLVSRYHPGWLWAHRPESPEPDGLPARRLWEAGRAKSTPITRVSGAAIRAGDEAALGAWLRAIHVDGLSIVEDLPPDRDLVPEIPHRIGCLRNSNFGEIWEGRAVRTRTATPSPASLWRLITTCARASTYRGCSFCSVCTTPAPGATASSWTATRWPNSSGPNPRTTSTSWQTVAVPFGSRNRDSDHRCRAPVLELDAAGTIATVRYTWWLRNPMSGDTATIKAFYAAFRRFQRLANDPGNQLALRLRTGDMAVFDNRRMLHGRTAFDPSSGRRWLRGCYSEREELESRLRMLARVERTRLVESSGSASDAIAGQRGAAAAPRATMMRAQDR